MTDFNATNDSRCARPAELDRLLEDLNRVLDAVNACDPWRPWLDDWREDLADAVTVDGDIVPEAEEEAEHVSGMRDVQTIAYRICARSRPDSALASTPPATSSRSTRRRCRARPRSVARLLALEGTYDERWRRAFGGICECGSTSRRAMPIPYVEPDRGICWSVAWLSGSSAGSVAQYNPVWPFAASRIASADRPRPLGFH